MAYYSFKTSRVSGDGNAVFPDEIIIDDEVEVVIHRKPKIIGCKESQIRYGAIASIQVDKRILFADIIIETRGGREIVSRRYTHADTDEIRKLLSFRNTCIKNRTGDTRILRVLLNSVIIFISLMCWLEMC